MWGSCEQRRVMFYSSKIIYFVVFFFFQAEDGIRDIGVTGVQTCALPILSNLEFDSLVCLGNWFNCLLLCILVWNFMPNWENQKEIWNNSKHSHSLTRILNKNPVEDDSFGLNCSSSCTQYPWVVSSRLLILNRRRSRSCPRCLEVPAIRNCIAFYPSQREKHWERGWQATERLASFPSLQGRFCAVILGLTSFFFFWRSKQYF